MPRARASANRKNLVDLYMALCLCKAERLRVGFLKQTVTDCFRCGIGSANPRLAEGLRKQAATKTIGGISGTLVYGNTDTSSRELLLALDSRWMGYGHPVGNRQLRSK